MKDIAANEYDNVLDGLISFGYVDNTLVSYAQLGPQIPAFHQWCIDNDVPDFVSLSKVSKKYLQLYLKLYDVGDLK